jgi:hypothetical protein
VWREREVMRSKDVMVVMMVVLVTLKGVAVGAMR